MADSLEEAEKLFINKEHENALKLVQKFETRENLTQEEKRKCAYIKSICLYYQGRGNEALNYFEKTIDSGYASREWIENDSDLDAIRNHPRFQEIMKKLK